MGKPITIGIADLNVGRDNDTLVTYALGSCVGICLYDAEKKIGGLAHIMLPSSKEASSPTDNLRRYADTCITELIKVMNLKGASVSKMTAKIAGGAQMFSVSSSIFNIGERNVISVKQILNNYKIRILADETGSNFGRTVFFHTENGVMEIRAATKPTLMR